MNTKLFDESAAERCERTDDSTYDDERAMERIAVRTFNRLAWPLIEASNLAAEADAGFDGGEWSRGWHALDLRDDLGALAERVAARFGMHRDKLDRLVHAFAWDADEKYFAAMAEIELARIIAKRQALGVAALTLQERQRLAEASGRCVNLPVYQPTPYTVTNEEVQP